MKMPKFTQAFIDRHGNARFYFRRAGFKRVPLPGLPWSPEFMAAYEAAMAGSASHCQHSPDGEAGELRGASGILFHVVRVPNDEAIDQGCLSQRDRAAGADPPIRTATRSAA